MPTIRKVPQEVAIASALAQLISARGQVDEYRQDQERYDADFARRRRAASIAMLWATVLFALLPIIACLLAGCSSRPAVAHAFPITTVESVASPEAIESLSATSPESSRGNAPQPKDGAEGDFPITEFEERNDVPPVTPPAKLVQRRAVIIGANWCGPCVAFAQRNSKGSDRLLLVYAKLDEPFPAELTTGELAQVRACINAGLTIPMAVWQEPSGKWWRKPVGGWTTDRLLKLMEE